MRLRYFIFICLSVFAFTLSADTYRIVRLSKSPITIGGTQLKVGSTFTDDKKIEWTDDTQEMQVVNTATGKRYMARRRVNPNAGRTHTIKDFIVRTSFGSTRDTEDDASLTLVPSPVGPEFPERRAALVIGNSNYQEMSQLRNAQGDAAAIADMLAGLGFDVMQLYEADERSMKNALRRFARQARGYDFVMFYFAGHGVQDEGFNYLLPVEARLELQSELRYCLSADDVVQQLDALPASARLIVLDACRNAHKSWTRSADEGLARMEAGEGTVILFSTQSGKKAMDGDGDHSPFATAMLENIAMPGVDFTHAINNVVRATYNATQKLQYPLLVGALLNDFSFNSKLPENSALPEIPQLNVLSTAYTPHATNTSSREQINEWVDNGKKAYDNNDYASALKWFQDAAKQDNAQAQFNLGVMYHQGNGVSKNFAKAFIWYQKAANQGHPVAQTNIGYMYLNGDVVEKNYTEALKWFNKAAEQGNAMAQSNIGFMYMNGYGVPKDYSEAIKWLRKAAEQDYAGALTNIGTMYLQGLGVPKDFSEALKCFRKAAEQGDAMAQNNIGVIYLNGLGVEKNFTEALKWFRNAAESGNVLAQNNLGLIYHDGEGVEKDYMEAAKWYQKAAEHEHAEAQNNLGCMYLKGTGVTQDFKEALKWFQKATENGDHDGALNLGVMYLNGYGITKDYTAAFKWFRKAAEQENARAQYNLGVMYQQGDGVTQNFTEAVKWYQKAASNGDSDGQLNLGFLYLNGLGIPKNFTEALKWFHKAAEQGEAIAQNNIGMMYMNGDGVAKDFGEALKWLSKSAEQGYPLAQFNIGMMYAEGKGVTKRVNEARFWLNKAAAQGHEGARKELSKLNE